MKIKQGDCKPTPISLEIPAPIVTTAEENWSRTNVFGDALTGNVGVYVSVAECPNEFFTDPAYDARVELLKCTKATSQSRADGIMSSRGSTRWTHPDDSVFNSGGRTRGGEQVVPRRSSWSILGLTDHDVIAKGDPNPSGRITLEDYHKLDDVTIRSDINDTPLVVQAPVVTGSKKPSNLFTPSQIAGRRPAYHAKQLNGYYAFRISIINPSGDGTPADRLTGSISQFVWVRPSPYPAFPTDIIGVWDGVSTNNLTASIGKTLNGF